MGKTTALSLTIEPAKPETPRRVMEQWFDSTTKLQVATYLS